MSELLTRIDVAQCDKDDLALNANIRFARMIAKDHSAFSFGFFEWADEEVFSDLYFSWTEHRRNSTKRFPVEYVAAFDANNFALFDGFYCEQASALDGAILNGGFG